MSGPLGLAAALRAVARLLDEAVAAANIAAFQGSTTAALPPEMVDGGTAGQSKPQLNLFPYHIGQTAAARNQDLPMRDASGEPIARPPLTLELHVILSAHAAVSWQAEALLGIAMRALHDEPVLRRERIRDLLTPAPGAADALVLAISNAGVADQFERLRLTPVNMAPADMQQLWTALPGRYRPSTAYLLSAVTLDSKVVPRTGLPVQRVASAVIPFVRPVIERAEPAQVLHDPDGRTITLIGSELRLPRGIVRFSDGSLVTPLPHSTDSVLEVPLPPALPAGLGTATLMQQVPIGAPPAKLVNASNAIPFVLRPVFALAAGEPDIAVQPAAAGVPRRLRIRLLPPPGERQQVEVLLNEAAAPAAAGITLDGTVRAETGNPIVADLTGVAAGDWIVRVRVDGAETELLADSSGGAAGPVVAL